MYDFLSFIIIYYIIYYERVIYLTQHTWGRRLTNAYVLMQGLHFCSSSSGPTEYKENSRYPSSVVHSLLHDKIQGSL